MAVKALEHLLQHLGEEPNSWYFCVPVPYTNATGSMQQFEIYCNIIFDEIRITVYPGANFLVTIRFQDNIC